VAMWEEHLLPLLTCKDAARLGCTCKALRVTVREQFRNVGTVQVEQLKAALTTFPGARTVWLDAPATEWQDPDAEVEALVEWLREGGGARGLERLMYVNDDEDLILKAFRAGALPSIKEVNLDLASETGRALLAGGLFNSLRELRLHIDCHGDSPDVEPEHAALGLVGQLPALVRLEVYVSGDGDNPVQWEWPPLIPPALKALRVLFNIARSLLQALPGMLGASGARLDRLEIFLPSGNFEHVGDGLVHMAQALHCCSPTLRSFYTCTAIYDSLEAQEGAPDHADQVDRLRAQWGGVLAGVSACRQLEVLELLPIKVEPLFPCGTAFGRLTHLRLSDHEPSHPPNAGGMGLWEVMASGGVPALAKLSVRLEGRWGEVEKVRSRVVPAMEAVADTLTHLHLTKGEWAEGIYVGREVGYELGVAVGKLRRLQDLALGLSQDGRVYHGMAQGLAASGGEGVLPLLWRISLTSEVKTNADQVASLLLPSVRVFRSYYFRIHAALLTACALRQAGYKHTWATCWVVADGRDSSGTAVLLAIAPCRIVALENHFDPWEMPRRGLPCDDE
jgi:hypothetical protein